MFGIQRGYRKRWRNHRINGNPNLRNGIFFPKLAFRNIENFIFRGQTNRINLSRFRLYNEFHKQFFPGNLAKNTNKKTTLAINIKNINAVKHFTNEYAIVNIYVFNITQNKNAKTQMQKKKKLKN